MLRTHALASLVLIATALPTSALAQDQGQLDEAARLTFESAREAFVAGDYETALARFRQAYQLSARPGLLYNIAQTLDRLRRDEETLTALRDYLRASPDAQNRSEVEARIRVLERAIADRRPANPPDTGGGASGSGGGGGSSAPSDPGLAILHPAFFLGAAGLALASGGVLIWSGIETLALNDAYLLSNDPATIEAMYASAESQQLLTNVFIGVTAGLGAIAAVLVIFTDWNAFGGGSERASLRPVLHAGPGGAWAGLGGTF